MLTLTDQVDRIRAEFQSRPVGLVRHVERVVEEATALAVCWDVDPDRTALAAWGHDFCKAESPASLLRLATEAGLPIDTVDQQDPVLLHGPVAAIVLEHRFDVTDGEALSAVRDHTFGVAQIPILGKIILIADKVEEHKRRRTPVMREIRRVARTDLDLALLCWADWKWVHELHQGWMHHPAHWRARRRWVAEHHIDRPSAPPVADAFED